MTDSPRKRLDNLQYAAVSHIGMRRLNNQDSCVVVPAEDDAAWQLRGHLFVVADGMGAHAAGELASKMAVDGVAHHYGQRAQLSPPEALLQAVRDTNAEIHQRGQVNSEFHNMGTTCSVLTLLPQGALIAHVGDSRVYRIREQVIEQLTFDHSLVWEMRAANPRMVEEGLFQIPKHVITRSLGPQAEVQIDLEGPLATQSGDTYLLCSDGLTGRVEDAEIGLIAGQLPPEDAGRFLVDLANLRGGPDNITILLARILEANAASRTPGEPLIVGQFKPPRPVPLAVWCAVIAGLVTSCGLAILQLWTVAALVMVSALAVLACGLLYRLPPQDGVTSLSEERRLGKAPYVRVECDPSSARIERLADSVRALARQRAEVLGDEGARVEACLDEVRQRARGRQPVPALQMLGVAVRILADSISSV